MKDYRLPKEVYMSTLWYIRMYPGLKEQCDAVIGGSPVQDGQPKSPMPGDPTFAKAAKLERLHDMIQPIEDAMETIPTEYRKGIFENIIDRRPYPDYAGRKTWKRWRQRYIYRVAILSGRYSAE